MRQTCNMLYRQRHALSIFEKIVLVLTFVNRQNPTAQSHY